LSSLKIIGRPRTLGLLALAAVLLATVFAASAAADTLYPPGTGAFGLSVTPNAGSPIPYVQTGSAPNSTGPTITNVTNGQSFTVSVNGAASGSAFARVRVRQCTAAANVNNIADFDPFTTNKCTSVPLGAGDEFKDSGALAPGTSTASVTFKVGTGTAPDTVSGFDGSTLPGFTCDSTHPCRLVIYTSVSSLPGSTNFNSYKLNFAPVVSSGVTLLDCSHLAGTTTVKPELNNTAQIAAESFKGTNLGSCTGPVSAQVGPLTKLTAKFSGANSCKTSTLSGSLDPMSGKLSLTYTTLDIKGHAVKSDAYVRVKYGADDRLDIAKGLVTKGIAVGSDVSGSWLVQPTDKDKTAPQPQSTIDGAGNVVPASGSQALLTSCVVGTGTIGAGVFGTSGTPFLGSALNSSIKFSLP
jgi:hypothetical protein